MEMKIIIRNIEQKINNNIKCYRCWVSIVRAFSMPWFGANVLGQNSSESDIFKRLFKKTVEF